MVCKEVTEILCDYLDGSLENSVKNELDEHFVDCPPCVAFLNTYKKTTELCKEAFEKDKIPEEVFALIKSYLMEKIK